jgi:proteasome accessory factor C
VSRAGRRQPDVVRMLTLIPWLLERPGISLTETAQAFAVDVETIRAELGHLDFCGLPGLGGGALFDVTILQEDDEEAHVVVRMADELRHPMRPTAVESLRLLLIATVAERIVGSEVPALTSALDKLHVALGVPRGAVDVLESEPVGDVLVARRAIADDVCLRFTYRGRRDSEPVERSVEPWAIELHDGAWYLHGHDRVAGEGRVFRLDRAGALEPTDEPRRAPVPARVPAPRYEPAEGDVEAELELMRGGEWLLDALEAERVEEGPTSVTVVLRVTSVEWLARLVLMAGGRAKVIRPDDVRERVLSRASEGLAGLRATVPHA